MGSAPGITPWPGILKARVRKARELLEDTCGPCEWWQEGGAHFLLIPTVCSPPLIRVCVGSVDDTYLLSLLRLCTDPISIISTCLNALSPHTLTFIAKDMPAETRVRAA